MLHSVAATRLGILAFLFRRGILAGRLLARGRTTNQEVRHEDCRDRRRRIEATDREIDRLVYELYGLTDEEIALVEGATG